MVVPALADTIGRSAPDIRFGLAGAGGIGSIAILLAHQFGAKVITTVSSPAKAEAVTKWGADLAINYKEEPFPEAVMKYTENKGADLILCFIGGDYVAKYAVWTLPFVARLIFGQGSSFFPRTALIDRTSHAGGPATGNLRRLTANCWQLPANLSRLITKLPQARPPVCPLHHTCRTS